MRPAVFSPAESAEYWTEERCFILELSNSLEDENLSIARARVKPGVTTRWHRVRDTAERYVIQSGTGRMEMRGHPPTDVKAGDVVLIPPDCPQRISNTGADDLIFLALCTPRFRPENYEDLEAAP